MKAIALSFLIAGLTSPASPLWAQTDVQTPQATAATAPDPAREVLDLVYLLRTNNLVGLVQAAVPPRAYDELRLGYESHRNETISDSDRAEFAEKLGKLTAPDAVDRLMTEIEPKLVEARPKAPGAIMMGLGAAQMALLSDDAELTTEQRETLQRALPGFQEWVTSTDFLSSTAMRQALTLVTDAVRRTGIRDVEQLQVMSFEQALAQAESVLAASKQALLIYGLDLDAIADSMRVEVLENDGKTARVRTTVTVFNAPVFVDQDLVLVDGHWYGKHAAKRWASRLARHQRG
ncbi:MAG: hypothetical protein Q8L45_09035 [Xanthomonadaceae bacterium]|nr:hypothetical protein [Xanthomonadaceae bacterium]MDP2184107.1 hypothetical protein [Xanthomonadales bacterium]MDZ4115879.1 hypothetical protein [Xanthomonadaceae bacterium]MDZ4377204.1 hypothetical protein [Xanthomonadaceae bacterium]